VPRNRGRRGRWACEQLERERASVRALWIVCAQPPSEEAPSASDSDGIDPAFGIALSPVSPLAADARFPIRTPSIPNW
jgi:hypothetical protein